MIIFLKTSWLKLLDKIYLQGALVWIHKYKVSFNKTIVGQHLELTMEMTSFFGAALQYLSLVQFVEAVLFRNFVIRVDNLVERLEEATETNKALKKSAEEKMVNLTTTMEQLQQENAVLKGNYIALNTTLSMMQNRLDGKFWCVRHSQYILWSTSPPCRNCTQQKIKLTFLFFIPICQNSFI